MEEINLFIYIAVVLTFTLLPIDGQNEINEFRWVGAPEEAKELRFRWVAHHATYGEDFSVYSDSCKYIALGFLCIEMETCLHNDSFSVGEQCYRSSTERLTWSNAKKYCNGWNATVASFSSVIQGITTLATMGLIDELIWVSDPFIKDNALYVSLESGDCNIYRYARYSNVLADVATHPVLCIELPPELITTQEITIASELITKPISNASPKSNAPQKGQNQLLNQNQDDKDKLVKQNRLHYKNQLVFDYYRLIEYYTEID